ncbi:MAG: glycosyl hydrolase, partial [Planctomycetota bacterium]
AAEKEGEKPEEALSSATLSALKLRNLGPALTSGRIGDFAVDPDNPARFFVAVCSGGVWKTENAGTTWKPIFDGEGSYSIGCLALDPTDSNVLWVGTGENNSQRSVSFGDGIYKSVDGGKSFKNMGLKDSEHIGMIAISPDDPDTVYVAAQGPLWRPGGDRGLYRSRDGGTSWEKILEISENTGVNEVHLDPRNPQVVYASAYQRRRRVWTLIDGGPESALYKSTDAGETWRKLKSGLPSADMGRIGLDLSPADPDVLYAIVEAAEGKGGVFRSTDRGESWEKRSGHMSTSPQYYNELFSDPVEVDRVYSLSTLLMMTEDGGKTWNRVPGRNRHVDDHALWIDPKDTDHLMVGCDGGVYTTWDRGAAWDFRPNLPVTQFYKVALDNASPFYNVYGGTQDNNTLGGPSRTLNPAGIANEDWLITVGGDGFEPQVDPTDPNIVYSQWQYAGLVRYDRRSGETIDIKPMEAPGEEPLRWNWDSPLLISPHLHTRLYFGANKLFQSDDRGDSWRLVSGDLTRQIDRDQLEVMGKIQNVDAVSKSGSTSVYGNLVALTESPLVEGLIYTGSDDGLVHVTADGGKNWRKISTFPGVEERTYVSQLVASVNAPDTVFAAFDNHKNGDFRPYLLKSVDRGETWVSIAGNLPERHVVYCVGEDHVNPNLLFAGTEFGLHVTLDGGEKWHQLKGGLPTIAVRDLELQRREDDLVLATFGRGFYVLDDYSPLRLITKELLEQPATLFKVKNALQYAQTSRLGGSGRGAQGASYYTAENPPYGAVFTYHLKEKVKTLKELRKEAEKEARKKKVAEPYPTFEELRAEDRETPPSVFLTISDESGQIVRRVPASRNKGIHRVDWDLRYPSAGPAAPSRGEDDEEEGEGRRGRGSAGPMALPGTYLVALAQMKDGVTTVLAGPESFEVIPLDLATLKQADRKEVLDFRLKMQRLRRAVSGASRVAGEADSRLKLLGSAYQSTPGAEPAILGRIHALEQQLKELRTELDGDDTLSSRNAPTPISITSRVMGVVGDQWNSTVPPTKTQRDAYQQAGQAFAKVLSDLRTLMEKDLVQIEADLEAAGAPWTPGRVPDWKIE